MTSKKLDIYHGYNILISLLLMRVFYEIDCRQRIFLGIFEVKNVTYVGMYIFTSNIGCPSSFVEIKRNSSISYPSTRTKLEFTCNL